tara:strand:- start:645 stop:1169 length:525 start_codon:yes stop_codon:yes gene_type:complete
MFRKLLTILVHTLLFTFLTKCETNTNTNLDTSAVELMESSTGAKGLDLKTVPVKKVNTQTLKVIEDWTALYDLKNEIIKMEQGDPSIFELQKNDIKQLFINLDTNIPNLLNTNNIWARIKVLETNAYKFFEASLKQPKESNQIKETKKNTINAYNILIYQINKTHEKYTQPITK